MAMQKSLSHRSCKRWLKRFLALFLFLLLLTAFFNFQADSAGVFRSNKGLKGVAMNLINGKMVAGYLGRSDERELERLIVENYPGRRDVIALGSSRSMLLRKRFLAGDVDFFNHAVSGGMVEDCVAIVGLYKKKGVLPRAVIIGMDPWMFNKNAWPGAEFWRILEPYYQEMVAEFPKGARGGADSAGSVAAPKASVTSKYGQLINLEYTLQNWQHVQKGKKLYVTKTADIDDYVREPDGSLHFPYKMRFSTMPQVGTGGLPDIIFSNFTELSSTELFEGLLQWLKNHGVTVVFLLPPLHPDVYQICVRNPEYGATLKVESYLRRLAADNGFTVVGSFDPARYGFKPQDFSDMIHGHESVMKRLFEDVQIKTSAG
ncbi:MAG TPA: hypothetical protein VMT71_16255 [Syntrophorhabdales bacterium]|nr:hypothetical protein [Syntrophorhabdales bacterium]